MARRVQSGGTTLPRAAAAGLNNGRSGARTHEDAGTLSLSESLSLSELVRKTSALGGRWTGALYAMSDAGYHCRRMFHLYACHVSR